MDIPASDRTELVTAQREPAAILAGPILYARGADSVLCRLTAVIVTGEGETAPLLHPQPHGEDGDAGSAEPIAPCVLSRLFGHVVWGYDFSLPAARPSAYRLGDERHEVASSLSGDVRIAFVSCNGQEHGDEERESTDRNAMWERLLCEHRERPFSLLVHGGDQLYADEAVLSHPELERWHKLPDEACASVELTDDMRVALRRYFFQRYLGLLRQPAAASLYARVPSAMIWDDHDIFDGWGSRPPGRQESAVARAIFAAAREMFMLFQLGAAPDAPPPTALDPGGENLGTSLAFPGFAVVLPDLRSERTPDRVMGQPGWDGLERALAAFPDGDRRIVVSSVPALGPRLSIAEQLLDFWPKLQKYEDDLRDQWQSRAHRGEWRRFLSLLEDQKTRRNAAVTVVSGEIHLATRAEMRLCDGSTLHQLVASGISHPRPSRLFPLALGLLSRLGQSPLRGRPIRIKPLPGRRPTYTAERNYLVLTRTRDEWFCEWELEDTGRTVRMAL